MGWGRKIVELELLGEAVGRELRPPEDPFRIPEVVPFPDPHQVATVPAGGEKTVFTILIPGEKTGFIRRVANTFYEGDLIYWSVDGKPVETPYIQRSLGSVSSPTEIVPWFRMPVKDKIEWRVKNKDVADHEYEILNQGFYLDTLDVPLLFKLSGADVL